ncbi:MAG TPA: DivIVA domain-containing protein [Deltaproteobacteria bacterium]|jgi:cell division initiation protein|nr:DivIVA domain-containing protein [Deltaproteobacteria bacterium]
MHLTPEMVREQRFRVKLSGFDKDEVVNFLLSIAEEMEEIMEENALLKSEIEALRSKQKDLEEIFLSAKQFSDEKKRAAEQEANTVTAEAKNTAAAMLAEAQQKIEDADQKAREIEEEAHKRAGEILEEAREAKANLDREILELKVKKMNFVAEIKSVIESYQDWINESANVDTGRG